MSAQPAVSAFALEESTRSAAEIVEKFLAASMVPDPETAARHIAADLKLTFTGEKVKLARLRFSIPCKGWDGSTAATSGLTNRGGLGKSILPPHPNWFA